MDSALYQLVALTCHANARLRGIGRAGAFFSVNSSCRGCERVSFTANETTADGAHRVRVIGATPDLWFAHLQDSGALGVRLLHRPQNRPGLADRESAGFVGGGGEWSLGVRYPNKWEQWAARWDIGNQQHPQRRIWRVAYTRVARLPGVLPAAPSPALAQIRLKPTLNAIHTFAEAQGCDDFAACFDRAQRALALKDGAVDPRQDLYPPDSLSVQAAALLDAAQYAWVFGGMGSWNDLGFPGEIEQTYQQVSEHLYQALIDAICAAANDSDPD